MEVGAQPIRRRRNSCGDRIERGPVTWVVADGDTSQKVGSKSAPNGDLRSSSVEEPSLVVTETARATLPPPELIPSLQANVRAKEVKALFGMYPRPSLHRQFGLHFPTQWCTDVLTLFLAIDPYSHP